MVVLAGLAALVAFGITAEDRREVPNEIVPRPFEAPAGPWLGTTLGGSGTFTDLIEWGGTLIGVGSGLRVDSVPFAWRSENGSQWVQSTGAWEPGDLITGVEQHGSGLIAVGYRLVDPFDGPGTAAVPRVWRSDDGDGWRPVETSGLPPAAVVTDLAHLDGLLVAVGWEGPAGLEPLAPPPETAVARVWTSRDGTDWQDATPDGASWVVDARATDRDVVLSGSRDGRASVWRGSESFEASSNQDPTFDGYTAIASTDTAEGTLVIVRLIRDVEGLTSVWNVDHDDWTRIEVAGRPDSAGWLQAIDGDVFGGPGFTRSIYPGGPELWVSDDGEDWIGVEVTGGPSPWPPSIVTTMTQYEGNLLALGSRGGEPTIWRLTER